KPVLDRTLAHGRGRQAIRVGFAPRRGVSGRGVAPRSSRDPDVNDVARVEERTKLTAHLRLAAIAVPRLMVDLHEPIDPRIPRPVRRRAPVDVAHRNEATRSDDAKHFA